MGVRALCAAAAVVVGTGQAADAATVVSYKTGFAYEVHINSAKIVGTNTDVSHQIHAGISDGDFFKSQSADVTEFLIDHPATPNGGSKITSRSRGYMGKTDSAFPSQMHAAGFLMMNISWWDDVVEYYGEIAEIKVGYTLSAFTEFDVEGKKKGASGSSWSWLALSNNVGSEVYRKIDAGSDLTSSQTTEVTGEFSLFMDYSGQDDIVVDYGMKSEAAVAPVPLPASALLLAACVGAMGIARRRHKATA